MEKSDIFSPAVEYNVPGYNRVNLSASRLHCIDAPVTIILRTPEMF